LYATGHSLGGTVAKHVNQIGLADETITFNAGSSPLHQSPQGRNEYNYHIEGDPISSNNQNSINIQTKETNPLKKHSIERFTQEDEL
jgi:hypothetical protein